jgi:hypothetical protein
MKERSKKKAENKEVKKEDDKWVKKEYPIILAWRLFVCLELGMS